MKKIYYLIIFCILSFSSCKKFLLTQPSDFISPEAYYTTAGQLQTALNAVYSQLSANEIYGYNLTYWLTTTNDETYQRKNTDPNVMYSYGTNMLYVERFWAALYSGIERANLLLDNVDKPDMSEDERKLIKGQTLFLRAYFYFLLVSNFGDVPLILSPTGSVSNVNIPRTPLKEVYNQILKDMIEAEDLLQAQTVTALGFGGKVSKTAVQGILARVCLTMAGYPLRDVSKYEDALMWAQKVVNSGEHALNPDYMQIFINLAQDKYDVKECIWEAEEYGNATNGYPGGGQALGNLLGIRNLLDLNLGQSAAMLYPTKWLFDLYEINPSSAQTPYKASFDTRRDWNCANYTYSGNPAVASTITNSWSMCTGKFRRSYTLESPKDKNFTPINCPILRYADILLMIAEAENEINGPTELAINAINQVRRRAYGKLIKGDGLKAITVTAAGSGYTTAPEVKLAGGGGSDAKAVAIVSGGKITSVLVSDPGTFYTSAPTISFSGAGTGAAATAVITSVTDADLPEGKIADKNSFRSAIQDERARELFTEGLRKADLIRWGIFVPRLKSMIDYGNANAAPSIFYTAYQNVDERHLLLPIPSREIGLNKALTQNPGW